MTKKRISIKSVINNFRNQKKAFTLVELLIVIAIMALLIGALIPSIDRSLSSNRLASDVEVFKSKLEEARLLAGSTQTNDEIVGEEKTGKDRVGYYGILIPGSDVISDPGTYGPQFYAIVRLSNPFIFFSGNEGYCTGAQALKDAYMNNTGEGTCLVEKVLLTSNVKYFQNPTFNIHAKLIAFRVPTQQVSEIYCLRPCSTGEFVYTLVDPPLFQQRGLDNQPVHNPPTSSPGDIYFKLSYKSKIATIRVEPFTAKITAEYE